MTVLAIIYIDMLFSLRTYLHFQGVALLQKRKCTMLSWVIAQLDKVRYALQLKKFYRMMKKHGR